MAGENQSLDADIEKTNAELDQGLRSCRSMLNDYRAVLTGQQEEREEEPGGGQATAAQWRTQEDSNL